MLPYFEELDRIFYEEVVQLKEQQMYQQLLDVV
jgi:hypothetical protein